MCGKTFESICKILSEAGLTVFRATAHKALTPPGNQEVDVLPQAQALATDPSVSTADWVHRKNGHHNARAGWHFVNDAKLPLEYSDFTKEGTGCPVCSKQLSRHLLKESGAICCSSQPVKNWQTDYIGSL